jgi:long-chain fatty acid transport protein
MGGVGIAAPQDAISATFANPAGMCFGPYCPGSEVNFAGTLFMPRPETKLTGLGPSAIQKDSDKKVYAIPAFGLSIPINPKLRFGLSAYGVSGLGVDYRDTGVPNNLNTQLQIMKFSPNIAYLVNDNLSVGLGLHIDYSALDLGSGTSFNYGVGAQVGAIYKVSDYVSLGITYKTPQNVDHENVSDFDGDTALDDLELESPQELGIGVAVEPMPGKLLIEVNAKWVNWGDAKGYEDFDWDDQYVIAVGAQFKPTEKLALRLGYNYGENPVQVHDNFDGTTSTNVQGKSVNTFNYEFLRIVGFPAIVEHHLTAGIGYEFSDAFAVNLGYMHAFEETITENGTIPTPVILESTLEEDSLEFGMTWRF